MCFFATYVIIGIVMAAQYSLLRCYKPAFSTTAFAAPHIMLAPTPASKYIAHHACIQDTAVYYASNCCGGPGGCHITIVIVCLDGGESNTACLAEHFSWDSV